jgi:hypothetical protein
MTRGLVRLSLICSILTCGLTSSADDVDDALAAVEAAEADFESAIDAAKQTLVNAYKQEIVKQTESAKLENVTRLATGLQLFEADGLLMEPELEEQYKVFGRASKAARDVLLETYRVASATLAASGSIEQVQEIQQKIRDRGLVSKLVSLQLTSKATLYLAHGNYKGFMEGTRTAGLNATFEMIVGLSTDGIVRESVQKSGIQGKPSEIVSFRSISVPNYYFAHGNHELLLQPYIDDNGFRQNSSFKIHKGLFRASAVSFEAVNFPDHYLAMDAGGFVRLQKRKPTAEFSRAATFTITRPKFPIW